MDIIVKGNYPWIKINADVSPPVLVCERCGKSQPVSLPAPINNFLKQSKAFTDAHKFCKDRE